MEDQNISSQPVQAPAPPLELKPEKRKFHIPKIAFLVIVFVILLAIIGGAYVMDKNANKPAPTPPISQTPSPTPDPTKDWKVTDSETNPGWVKYTNSVLGYSFEIPNTWKNDGYVDDTGNPMIDFKSPDFKMEGEDIAQGSQINISSRKTSETSVINNFNKDWGTPKGGPTKPEIIANPTVDNINAIQYEITWEGDEITTEFIKDSMLYQAAISFHTITGPQHNQFQKGDLSIYNQILSTFKFTNQNPEPASSTSTSPDISTGPQDAKVTLIVYSDFSCPACANYNNFINQAKQDYQGKVNFIYRFFPLQQLHPNANSSSYAAYAAHKQGKYWEMANLLFTNQKDWVNSYTARSSFLNYASGLGLNPDQFNSDYDSQTTKSFVKNQYDAGLKSGINTTPTFILNGLTISTPASYNDLKFQIDNALNSN